MEDKYHIRPSDWTDRSVRQRNDLIQVLAEWRRLKKIKERNRYNQENWFEFIKKKNLIKCNLLQKISRQDFKSSARWRSAVLEVLVARKQVNLTKFWSEMQMTLIYLILFRAKSYFPQISYTENISNSDE